MRCVVVVVAVVAGAGCVAEREVRPACLTAIALRDDVPDYQKTGSETFTSPTLAQAYAESHYLTASADDDGHDDVVAALREAHDESCAVDLFFLDNSGDFAAWVESMDAQQVPQLHLVYDTGAGNGENGDRWMALGAAAAVGHGGDNIAPVFYSAFLPSWTSGAQLDGAVAAGDTAVATTLLPLGDGGAELLANTKGVVAGDGTITIADR